MDTKIVELVCDNVKTAEQGTEQNGKHFLSTTVVQEISREINQAMKKFRQEFANKEAMSEDDTSKIILNS